MTQLYVEGTYVDSFMYREHTLTQIFIDTCINKEYSDAI